MTALTSQPASSVPGPPPQRENIVLLLHGIRTEAPWAEMVRSVLEGSELVDAVRPIGYGWFDLIRFLVPGPWRRKPANRVARELNEIRAARPGAEISVLAHSFGTYTITRALLENPHLRLKRLCLCGTIVPRAFPWGRIAGTQVAEPIVNDCGTRDIWPILAASLTFGYGPTGTVGCRTVHVDDRFHPVGHSDFFDPEFAARYWRPYFGEGTVSRPPDERGGSRQAPPWWQSALPALRILWLAPMLAAAMALPHFRAVQPTSTPEPLLDIQPGLAHIPYEGLADVALGETRSSFHQRLVPPRVSRNGSIPCDPSARLDYDRWSDAFREVQVLFADDHAAVMVVREHQRNAVPFRYRGKSAWALRVSRLKEISEADGIHGAMLYEDGRYPTYLELHYFGRPGDYHSYYFSVANYVLEGDWGPADLYDAYRSRMSAMDNLALLADFDQKRARTVPNAVAIVADHEVPECSSGAAADQGTDWTKLVERLAALPADSVEHGLEPNGVWQFGNAG